MSDVEMIRVQGTDLCAKSEQYSKVVETELRTVITNFEDLNRRLNLAQVIFKIFCQKLSDFYLILFCINRKERQEQAQL